MNITVRDKLQAFVRDDSERIEDSRTRFCPFCGKKLGLIDLESTTVTAHEDFIVVEYRFYPACCERQFFTDTTLQYSEIFRS